MSRLTDELQNTRKIIDVELDKLLPTINIPENRVVDAMRYSAIGAGKALRPFLVITCAKIFGVPTEVSVRTATALESGVCRDTQMKNAPRQMPRGIGFDLKIHLIDLP